MWENSIHSIDKLDGLPSMHPTSVVCSLPKSQKFARIRYTTACITQRVVSKRKEHCFLIGLISFHKYVPIESQFGDSL